MYCDAKCYPMLNVCPTGTKWCVLVQPRSKIALPLFLTLTLTTPGCYLSPTVSYVSTAVDCSRWLCLKIPLKLPPRWETSECNAATKMCRTKLLLFVWFYQIHVFFLPTNRLFCCRYAALNQVKTVIFKLATAVDAASGCSDLTDEIIAHSFKVPFYSWGWMLACLSWKACREFCTSPTYFLSDYNLQGFTPDVRAFNLLHRTRKKPHVA